MFLFVLPKSRYTLMTWRHNDIVDEYSNMNVCDQFSDGKHYADRLVGINLILNAGNFGENNT